MCQWCNLLMFVAFLYLYNSKEFLFSFGFEYFIKLWIYPLLFVAFFFRRLCIWGGTTDIWHTRTHVGKLFYLHPVSNHFQCDMIIITVVDIMVRSSRVHTSITPRVVFFFSTLFLVRTFSVSVRSAFVSETLWSNTLFRFFFCTIRVLLCCGLFLYVRPIKCIHCARTVNDTCCSCLPLLFFTVLPSIYNPFWPEIYFSVFRRFCWRS